MQWDVVGLTSRSGSFVNMVQWDAVGLICKRRHSMSEMTSSESFICTLSCSFLFFGDFGLIYAKPVVLCIEEAHLPMYDLRSSLAACFFVLWLLVCSRSVGLAAILNAMIEDVLARC
jgi:hypothetical protein